jgi:hypothetical protein
MNEKITDQLEYLETLKKKFNQLIRVLLLILAPKSLIWKFKGPLRVQEWYWEEFFKQQTFRKRDKNL